MILSYSNGLHLAGLMRYLHLSKSGVERASAWRSSLPVGNWREMPALWKDLTGLYERGRVDVFHFSLSPVPREALSLGTTDILLLDLGEAFVTRAVPGFDWHLAVHRGEGRPHVHMAVCPVSQDCSMRLVLWKPDVERLDAVKREVAGEFGFSCVEKGRAGEGGESQLFHLRRRVGTGGYCWLDDLRGRILRAVARNGVLSEENLAMEGVCRRQSRGRWVYEFVSSAGQLCRASEERLRVRSEAA